jgi:hypothetical protein
MESVMRDLYIAIAVMTVLVLLNVILTVNGLSPFHW